MQQTIIAVTGNLLSGKTQVTRILARDLGFSFIISDEWIKHFYSTSEGKHFLIDNFGKECFNDGILQTSLIAEVVFSDEIKRIQLENFVYPKLIEHIKNLAGKSGPILVEVPLLFEKRWHLWVDIIILVRTTASIRKQRALIRHYDDFQLSNRLALQMDDDLKIDQVDYMIDNIGTLNALEQQVRQVAESIKSRIKQ